MTASKKSSVQRPAVLAKGGRDHMLPKQSAGPQKPGGTAHAVNPGSKRAAGGTKQRGVSLSRPAKAGHTAPPVKGR
jgi:hypothetical protein